MLNTYLDQLEAAAEAANVSLAEACKKEGIALTTLMRWRKAGEKGGNAPREATAIALFRRIEAMQHDQRKAS